MIWLSLWYLGAKRMKTSQSSGFNVPGKLMHTIWSHCLLCWLWLYYLGVNSKSLKRGLGLAQDPDAVLASGWGWMWEGEVKGSPSSLERRWS
jgi:hypothetical protein